MCEKLVSEKFWGKVSDLLICVLEWNVCEACLCVFLVVIDDALYLFDPCVLLPWPGHKPVVNHWFVVTLFSTSSSPIQLPPSIPPTIHPTSSHFPCHYSNLSFIYSSSQCFSPLLAAIVTEWVTTSSSKKSQWSAPGFPLGREQAANCRFACGWAMAEEWTSTVPGSEMDLLSVLIE